MDMPLPLMPENCEDLQLLINKLQNRYKYRDGGTDLNLLRMMKAYYYACVSFVDYQIGRILDTLEQTGQMENTVIVFTADHGELLGDYNCFGKRSMHNASVKIPLIICGGEFEGGGVCHAPVSLVDIAPTLISVAGGDPTGMTLDGEDLASVKNGTSTRKGVYSFYSATGEVSNISAGKAALSTLPDALTKTYACMNMMYAERDLKYVYSAPDNREWLFDLSSGSPDAVDLSGSPEYEQDLARMRSCLLDFLKGEGFTQLIDGDHFNPPIQVSMTDNPREGLIRQDFRPPWFSFDALRDYQKD
jgi:arylsulfatase A-like enzyme